MTMTLGAGRAADADAPYFSGEPLNFELWCMTLESLPAERCAAREARDVARYEDYVERSARFGRDADIRTLRAPIFKDRRTNPGAIIVQ